MASAIQPKRFGDKYILLDRIATGGMAEVYRGKLTGVRGFEKMLAIKKMLPHLTREKEMVEHFIDEAKLAALLQHDNIIHIYDFGALEGSYFIAMEYLFGKDLNSVLRRSGQVNRPLSIENALLITSQICQGMQYAHNLTDLHGKPLHIIHRDITPHNIFITYDGKVKIIDFGIAKTQIQSTQTQIGLVKGKVAYMSPEQVEGRRLDHRSDIFTIGILLYEMLTHQRLYQGNTMQVIQKAIEVQYEPLENFVPDLPEPLYAIIRKALAKETDQRYQSCDEMRQDIENCMYNLKYRTNSQQLGAYVIALFKEDYRVEREAAIQAMDSALGDESGGREGVAETDVQAVQTPPEFVATVFMTENDGVPPKPHAPAEPSSGAIPGGKQKWIMLAGVILAVLAGVGLGIYFINRPQPTAPKQPTAKPALTAQASPSEKAPDQPQATATEKPAAQAPTASPTPYQESAKLAKKIDNSPKPEIAKPVEDIAKAAPVEPVNLQPTPTRALSDPKKPDQTQPRPTPNARRINNLLQKAEASMRAKKLTTPQNDCALKYYAEVLKEDPYNAAGRKGIQSIGDQYASWADQALKSFRVEKARRLVNKGLSVTPEHKQLLALQKELQQQKPGVIINQVDRKVKKIFRNIFD